MSLKKLKDSWRTSALFLASILFASSSSPCMHLFNSFLPYTSHFNRNNIDRTVTKLGFMNRTTQIREVFMEYMSHHSHSALISELESNPKNLCLRRYIFVPTITCDRIGNIIFSPLNSLSTSVIINRTLIIDGEEGCKHLIFQDWIIRQNVMRDLLRQANCTDFLDLDRYAKQLSKKELACHLDENPVPVFTMYEQEWHPFRLFNNRSGAILGPESTRRASILLSNADYRRSGFELFGYASSYLFNFSEEVVDTVSPQLDLIMDTRTCVYHQHTMVIGTHMRHGEEGVFNATYDLPIDLNHLQLIEESISRHKRNRPELKDEPCFLLLATDRVHTILTVMNFSANVLNCSLLLSHQRVQTFNASSYLEYPPNIPFEHGPFGDELLTIADLYLLFHSQHFVSSSYPSTYSDIVSDIIEWKHSLNPGHSFHSLWNVLDNYEKLNVCE